MGYQEYIVAVCDNGDKFWRQNGVLHRTGGPAVEYANGDKHWYQNERLHRTDGPAIEYPNGDKHWYLEGKQYSEAEFNALTQKKLDPCNGKVIEIDGKKYTITAVE